VTQAVARILDAIATNTVTSTLLLRRVTEYHERGAPRRSRAGHVSSSAEKAHACSDPFHVRGGLSDLCSGIP
jgi:hypothetical protein